MLAGLMKAPTKLAPNRNPAGAQRARRPGGHAMAQEGFITEAMAKLALAHPAQAVRGGAGSVNYAADYVMDVLDDTVGAIDEDIVVTTTISAALQADAEQALTEELDQKGAKFGVGQGALVSIDAGRRDQGAGRRPQLRRQPVRPRGLGQAPAGLGVQALRLSRRARKRPDAGERARGRADQCARLAAGELFASIFRPGHADARRCRCRSTPWRCGSASRSARRPWSQTAHRLGIVSELDAERLDRARHLRGHAARTRRRLCALRQWRHRRAAAYHRAGQDGGRQAALSAQGREQWPRHRSGLCGDDERDAAGDAAHRHGAQGRSCRAGRRRARPAPARIAATPGSSATRAISSPASGSATTTVRRPKRPRAAICRWRSGRATCASRMRASRRSRCRAASGKAPAEAPPGWPWQGPASMAEASQPGAAPAPVGAQSRRDSLVPPGLIPTPGASGQGRPQPRERNFFEALFGGG